MGKVGGILLAVGLGILIGWGFVDSLVMVMSEAAAMVAYRTAVKVA